MQPPRPRRPRERESDAQILIAVILDLGAAILTALLFGIVTRAATDSSSGVLGKLDHVMTILAWPFERILGLPGTLGLVVITVVVAVVWIAVLGIVAGWEAEGRSHPRFSHLRRP